jgi:AAHS family 3-hydroxyphenylpropionic acid transporter
MNNQSNLLPNTKVSIVLCIAAAFCEGIDLQAAGVAAAGIAPAFKPSAQQLGSFFSASTMGLFIGALLGGWWSDRVGRKQVLINSIAIFGVFSLLTAFAWDISSLTWARFLTGLGLGGALPNLIALVSESSADNRRSASVAMVYAGTPLGGALISLVAYLTGAEQWRAIFIIGGIVPLLLVPLMRRYLQESATFTQAQAAAVGKAKPGFMLVFAEGRAVTTVLLWVSFFLALLTLYLLLNWLPTLMTGGGMSKSQAAFTQIGFNLGGAMAALLIGRLMEGPLRLPSVMLTFIALPLLLWWLAQMSASLALMVLIVFLLGCAVVAAQAFLYATAPALYPTVIRGLGVGLAVAIGRIGSIVGPEYGGMLKAQGKSSAELLLSLVPIAVVGGICAITLAWRGTRKAE